MPSATSSRRNSTPSQQGLLNLRARREAGSRHSRGSRHGRGKPPEPEADPFGLWLAAVTPSYNWSWRYLRHIRERLAAVTAGSRKRLMLFLPPRHGKSEMTTVRYPVYRMENNPAFRVCVGAYNQRFAERFGRKARRVADRRFQLSDDRKASCEWETPAGGVYRSCGVGSPPTGEGFDLIVIDDPVKSREEANSEAYRNRVEEWYTDDLYTRLEPGGAIVLIMTRWHDDDLAGRILASEDGPSWEVVNLPAEAEEGDPLGRPAGAPLCPDRYDSEALAERRRVLGLSYYPLFQQRPVPPEGNAFKPGWLRRYQTRLDTFHLEGKRCPVVAVAERFGTVDFAFTAGQTQKNDPDYTVVSSWGLTPGGELLWLGCYRDRLELPDIPARVAQEYRAHRLARVYVEANGPQKGAYQLVRRHTMADGRFMNVIPYQPVSRETLANSAPILSMAEAGRLWLPDDDPAFPLAEVVSEVLRFTGDPKKDKHDDIVITAAMAGDVVCRDREARGGHSSTGFRPKRLGAK